MATAAFSYGTFPGGMADLVVSPSVQVDNGRQLKESVSTGGVRWVQRPRRNPRKWDVSRPWRDAEFVRRLAWAAHGLVPEVWLYDRACAQQNLIPVRLAATPGTGVSVDGLPMGPVSWAAVTVRVLAGRTYTVSCWTAGAVSPLSVKIGAGAVQPLPVPTSGYSELVITPSADALLTLSRAASPISGVSVREGTGGRTFHATEGTPCRVAVVDPERTYELVSDTGQRTSYSITLMEVGDTGA